MFLASSSFPLLAAPAAPPSSLPLPHSREGCQPLPLCHLAQVTLDEVTALRQMRREPNCFLPGGAVCVVRPRTVSGELINDPEATKHNTIKLEALGEELEDDIAALEKQRMTSFVLPFAQYRDEVLREIDRKLKALLRLSKV